MNKNNPDTGTINNIETNISNKSSKNKIVNIVRRVTPIALTIA